MRRLKTTLKVLAFLIVGGMLHYVLPQHDIVRVTSTEVIRMDFNSWNRPFFAQADSGASELSTRDIRLIYTEKKKTWLLGFIGRDARRVMVYRNEDTGWIWPPYFKFDSSDLQAQAAALISTTGEEQWAVMTHYGWRNKYLTVFPNAIGIRPVEGPDVRVIPWFNIFFFGFVIVAFLFLRAAWRQFRERAIDPALQDAEAKWDEVSGDVAERRGRVQRWLDTWRAKK